jgi:hypothetical protein
MNAAIDFYLKTTSPNSSELGRQVRHALLEHGALQPF